MPTRYCTLEDVRRALLQNVEGFDSNYDLDGDGVPQAADNAITAESEPLEKSLKRHWFDPDSATLASEPKTRDDEYSIPTSSAFVVGDNGPVPKTSQGDYAKIDLDRRDAESIKALHVRQPDGTYEDWVASDDYTEGSWPPSGEDYYLRVNNGGWSRLYLDVTNFLEEDEDDEYVLDSWANAVYAEFSYGHSGIPENVRRAVALRAGAELVEEAVIEIPQNATIYGVDTKAEKMQEKADELLEVYR